MDINFFDLSGGINLNSTKTDLGINKNKLYWTDSKNVEIYLNKGITKQKGNTLFLELPTSESITGINEMEADGKYKLVITTISGKIYIYSSENNELRLLNKTIHGSNVKFTPFLKGILVYTESDNMFYIKNNSDYEIVECPISGLNNETIYPECVTIYKGRVWCSYKSTIFYSALGTYNDFTTEDDAGYINEFHTESSDITGMRNYKDYLAIYKKDKVYLLSGASQDNFAITLFADKGTVAQSSIINVDNRQYFLSNGIYSLEQVGDLNQLRLGNEISLSIKPEFEKFDRSRINKTTALHYQNKNQIWYFIPYQDSIYYKTIWINDYVTKTWYKREVPQNLTCACMYNYQILSADSSGKIYIEDYGTTFNGLSIPFMWKSPFLALTNAHHRKVIDEFYFVLDDEIDNKFKFSVYKDYDGTCADDREEIFSRNLEQFIWAPDNEDTVAPTSLWNDDNSNVPIWTINSDTIEKAEICGSCLCVQLCVEGTDFDDNCAIIGLQFREIYNDD
jgi:hypothetical protein